MSSIEMINSNIQQPSLKKQKKVILTCGICIEPFNKTTHLLVKCPFCLYECCRICCETYILSESVVKCMSPECAKTWTRKQIRERFTLTFINIKLKKHTEKILFDKERALLPATQPIVERKIKEKKILNEISVLNDEIKLMNENIKILKTRIREKSIIYYQIVHHERTEARVFIRGCPDENCRGFLSTQWKCGICEKWSCPDCNLVKGYTRDSEHTCNEDDVATATLLAKDTKPCPKCGTGIFKIDGCDQMWCTQCHTPFSWKTGNIESNIHNPHYFEWMRLNGNVIERNPHDVQCGQHMDHQLYGSFNRIIRDHYKESTNSNFILGLLNKYIRNSIHIVNVEQPAPINYEARNEKLRVSYLMNELTEEGMRDSLQRADKRHHRNRELTDIYALLISTVTDILYRFNAKLKDNWYYNTTTIDLTFIIEIKTIVEYVNECLSEISHTYSSSLIVIRDDLQIFKGKKAKEFLDIIK